MTKKTDKLIVELWIEFNKLPLSELTNEDADLWGDITVHSAIQNKLRLPDGLKDSQETLEKGRIALKRFSKQ